MTIRLKILFLTRQKQRIYLRNSSQVLSRVEQFGVSRRVGCIHALVGEAAVVRILVNLCRQSKHVASSQSSKGTVLPPWSKGAVDEEASKGQL